MKKPKKGSLIENSKVRIKSERCEKDVSLNDLIQIFNEEAYKICKNKQTAKMIALKSLQEYIKKNVNVLKIIL